MIELEAHTHARLGASSAARWMACPDSVIWEEGTSSIHAAEGTVAHWLAEQKLDRGKNPKKYLGKTALVDGYQVVITAEMVDEVYLAIKMAEWLWERATVAEVYSETDLTVNLRKVDPDLGGTADLLIYYPKSKTVRVVDFKFGRGFVWAENNPQLLIYAIGAMHRFPEAERFIPTIIQPKWKGAGKAFRDCSVSRRELELFELDVAIAAANTRDERPSRTVGPHCRYCPKRFTCPDVRKLYELIEETGGYDLTDRQKLDIVACDALGKLDADRTQKLQSLLAAGEKVPGWELRESTRDRQPQWKNPEEMLAYFLGDDRKWVLRDMKPMWEGVTYERVLRSPAEIKALDPKLWERVKHLTEEPPPAGAALWPEDAPVSPVIPDFEALD